MSTSTTSSTEEKALKLLGRGLSAEVVASAIGVDPSRISQLVAQESFKEKLVALKYEELSKNNDRDSKYDSIEDSLVQKFETILPWMHKPQDILRAMQVVNGLKRRGTGSDHSAAPIQSTTILNMPIQVIQKFTTNINNQVVQAGDQNLVTIPSSSLLKKIESIQHERTKEQVSLGLRETKELPEPETVDFNFLETNLGSIEEPSRAPEVSGVKLFTPGKK